MRRRMLLVGCVIGALALLGGLWWLYQRGVLDDPRDASPSNNLIRDYLQNPDKRAAMMNAALLQCPDAPFILPSAGLIGLIYADTARPYSAARRHTGLDIFGNGAVGTVPIYAAYDGWLSRLPDWKSSVIIRHDDPLQAGRVIWTYYTHMASLDGAISTIVAQFPPGTTAQPVAQGTLLGYQGEYAGAGAPIAMHLHFSIVLSDSQDAFLNESILTNTLDPSPYFGMGLNISDDPQPRPIACQTGR